MSKAICDFCNKQFNNLAVPENHKCAHKIYTKDKYTLKRLNKLAKGHQTLYAAIDMNADNLGWVFGSDGVSFLIENILPSLSENQKKERKAIPYFRAVAEFLSKRYSNIYVGDWRPNEQINNRTQLNQFLIMLQSLTNVITISEKLTTVTCSLCGYQNSREHIKDKRVYFCQNCHEQVYRDENSARNILNIFCPGNPPETKNRFIVRMFRVFGRKTGCDISHITESITVSSRIHGTFILDPTEFTENSAKRKRKQKVYFQTKNYLSPIEEKTKEKPVNQKRKNKVAFKRIKQELLTGCCFCGEDFFECLVFANPENYSNVISHQSFGSGRVREEKMRETLNKYICVCRNCFYKQRAIQQGRKPKIEYSQSKSGNNILSGVHII